MPAAKKTKVAKRSAPAAVIATVPRETLSKLVLKGDLSGLSETERMDYYFRFCEHLGLDPVTRPFDLLNLSGKLVLYAHKGCTDQLRKKYGVSVTDLRGETIQDCYRVTALGRDHTGRTDASTGVVKVGGLLGDNYANAVMKAETKAKRRLTLSLCGLGMLDESEIETIPGAMTVDFQSGEPIEPDGSPAPPREAETETIVGEVPPAYWGPRNGPRPSEAKKQMILVEKYGPAKRYEVRKIEDQGWRVVKIDSDMSGVLQESIKEREAATPKGEGESADFHKEKEKMLPRMANLLEANLASNFLTADEVSAAKREYNLTKSVEDLTAVYKKYHDLAAGRSLDADAKGSVS